MHTDASAPQPAAASPALVLTYGVVSYLIFFATFLYLIGFVGGFAVPVTLDVGGATSSTGTAIAINVLLLGIFAVQHTIMARRGFKEWWTRICPVPMERSTFVLITSLLLILMVVEWRPLPEVIWNVGNEAVRGVIWVAFAAGWGIVLLSTFLIDHFDLFGLKQSVLFARGKEYEQPHFQERLLYRVCRHPLMLGFLIAFWAAPTMTQGHLLFAVVTTVYILIAIQIEEHGLIAAHGDSYADYRRRVSMLMPRPPRA